MPLLNGQFEVTIGKADKVPQPTLSLMTVDPMLQVQDCRGHVIVTGPEKKATHTPEWNLTEQVSIVETKFVSFKIWNDNVAVNDLLCEAKLDDSHPQWASLLAGNAEDIALNLPRKGKDVGCVLTLTIKPLFHLTGGTLCAPGARFNSRTGCRVTLFQSAHIGSERDYLPNLNYYAGATPMADGSTLKRHKTQQHDSEKLDDEAGARAYTPRNCWEELYCAILNAKHVIYMVGWSVSAEITLLRERNIVVPGYESIDGTKTSVGELLQMKAEEGVVVNVLIWNEVTSCQTSVGSFDGVAATYAGQTRAYFAERGNKVTVVQHVRAGTSALDNVRFTHHQKCVIMDADSLEGMPKPKRMIAFMGGLDVTGGRFDTPKKHIFEKADTWYANDYYQGCINGADPKHDCREPWQDIHLKLEGQVVWDLIQNFHDRWATQGAAGDEMKLFHFGAVGMKDTLCRRGEDDVGSANAAESWNVQFLRSIDKFSAKTVRHVEADIHLAYENAIQNAERYIYVENQYFLGGAQAWAAEDKVDNRGLLDVVAGNKDATQVNAVNRIPLMLCDRIFRAIDEGKPFAVYACIPMFPEGLPDSAPLQEIIYWEHRTMKMMFKKVTQYLQQKGSTKKARDYLNFFCLGNRERNTKPRRAGEEHPRQKMAAESQRHMVYVHSKMLIVDDDYIIVGSANINDRSMAGDRDTEIAVGCYQPHYSKDKGQQYPNGHVNAFRLSLWGEHLNEGAEVNPVLYYPESQACVEYVQRRTQQAWEDFMAPQFKEMQCHLMAYPIKVDDSTGDCAPLMEVFPDFTAAAKIAGTQSALVPDWMTT